ncbi:MAG: bifunctional hydroxymethylpyrimidine kinase/phosphomethylpyrimidine kinase [Microbacteriaceae bacterium]|nr:bifunctional hydroxymethylpyrimidine kinase/phosphomethylpyrimidine kinase [Microbacteriaceae bacterium]
MRPPIALTIAGSDPSGGAGIQADLKTFSAHGVYGASVITALTAQNTQGVSGVHTPPVEFFTTQLASVIDDLPVDATKIGMLANAEIAGALADAVEARRADFGTIVLDPVMVATSGDRLLAEDAVRTIRERLLPLADVITPNIPEAALLLDCAAATCETEMREQGERLLAFGAKAVMMKGGHLESGDLVDIFVHAGGAETFIGQKIETRNTHGTGCTLAAALAANFALAARDSAAPDAAATDPATIARKSRDFLVNAIKGATDWQISKTPETGHGPVNHLLSK